MAVGIWLDALVSAWEEWWQGPEDDDVVGGERRVVSERRESVPPVPDASDDVVGGERRVVLERRESVPPVPDASLVWETLELGDKPITVRAGVVVDRARALREHGDLGTYRRRLVWQMVKRKWFGALTEETTRGIGDFVSFVGRSYATVSGALLDDPIVGPHAKSGAVRLILKGGNVVNLVKAAAVRQLGSRVETVGLKGGGISDVDYYCFIDKRIDDFDIVHRAARDAARRALRGLSLPAAWRNSDVDLGSLLERAVQSLRDELEAYGDLASNMPEVHAALSALAEPGAMRCSPYDRRDLDIRQLDDGVELVFADDEPRPAYVSHNHKVEHRDARCVTDDDVCAFSLVRLLVGFAATPTTPDARVALRELSHVDADHVLVKGEGVDVSFPHHHDVNLGLWVDDDKFVTSATLGNVHLYCESLDALILEQRDLTFGKRAQHVLIWRVAKAAKRLRRLVELLGIKLLASDASSWQLKATALALLHVRLDNFANALDRRHEHHATTPLKNKPPRRSFGVEEVKIAAVVSDAPKTSGKPHSNGTTAQAHATHDVPAATLAAAARLGLSRLQAASCRDVFDAALVTEALLLPLDHLALRVFADKSTGHLPPTFATQWRATLEPLIDLIALFRDAARGIAALPDASAVRISEDLLYHWDAPAPVL